MIGPEIDILLSTHNGEMYLREQIDSLLRQTYKNWRLIVRDDGSTDGTVGILESYEARHPDRLRIVDRPLSNIGSTLSFGKLLALSAAQYFMFCDQDDVWLPEKIEKTLAKMAWMETEYGAEIPLLAHTDLRVVDAELQTISNSFYSYKKLDPHKDQRLNRLLQDNVVVGCTAMGNSAFRSLASPIPENAFEADWWLALVVAMFGRMGFLDEATILYRRHGKNIYDWHRWSIQRLMSSPFSISQIVEQRVRKNQKRESQAKALADRFDSQISPNQKNLINIFSSLSQQSLVQMRIKRFKYGFVTDDIMRNIRLFIIP